MPSFTVSASKYTPFFRSQNFLKIWFLNPPTILLHYYIAAPYRNLLCEIFRPTHKIPPMITNGLGRSGRLSLYFLHIYCLVLKIRTHHSKHVDYTPCLANRM